MRLIILILISQSLGGNLFAVNHSTETHEENMVRIPSGTFVPFYSDSSAAVKVLPFLMDKYLVTNAAFLEFVKQFPEWRKSKVKPIFADSNYLKHWNGDLSISDDANNSPVTSVSWFAAKAYCESQGKRLPTKDEWEYTARADENSPDGIKNPNFMQRILDWYSKPTPQVLPPVGSTFKNYYGVYDTHGLVWEWALDFNSTMLTGESRQDKETDKKLFCAGDSISATDVKNYAAFMRYAFRSSLRASFNVANLGFRCAKSLKQ